MKRIFCLIAGFAATMVVCAQPIDLMQVVTNDSLVRTGTLGSGIRYYIRANKKDAQRASFHIVYDVGALQEQDRQDGLAHFLEHMAFNGSKNFPKNSMIDYLQSIGVGFGDNLNAGTSQQMTTYMIKNVPITRPGIVDSVLLVLHDWAGFISLDGQDIDKERGVIEQEWQMVNSQADRRARQKLLGALFGEQSLYARRSVIGTMENLKAFTYDDIRDFYKKWYRPDMQAFVIVGDFDVDTMEAKLRLTMSDIEPHKVKTPKNRIAFEPNAEPRVAVITDPEFKENTVDIYFLSRPLDKKYNNTVLKFNTDLINHMALIMINERLDDIAKNANAPFQAAGGYMSGYFEPCDMLVFSATSRQGEYLTAMQALYTEVLRMSRGGFVDSELQRAKKKYLAEVELAFTNRNDRRNDEYVAQLTDNFIDNASYPDAKTEYELTKSILQTITLEQINAQMAAAVSDQNQVITLTAQSKDGVVIPTQGELLAVREQVENSQIEPYQEKVVVRELMDPSKLKGSKVVTESKGKFNATEWTLKNGIKVVVLPTTYKADEVILNATKKGGKSTINSLDELYSINLWGDFENFAGLSDMSDSELKRVVTGKNVSLSPVVNNFSSGYAGKSTVKEVETMLQLTYLYATAPRWQQADWQVMIDKLETKIKGSEKDPMRIFADSVAMTQFDHNERNAQLNKKTLSMVSLDKMRSVYQKLFGSAGDMTFCITGSVNLDTIRPLVEKYIGSLPVSKKAAKAAIGPNISRLAKGRIVNRFETQQESAKVIALTLFTGDIENLSLAERLNLDVAGDVLNTVYTRTIREEKGGTYVMQNIMQIFDQPTPIATDIALFMTDTTLVDELLPLIDQGVQDICENGPSTENLTKAKENLAKNFIERNNTNDAWNRYMNDWYNWQIDYTDYLSVLDGVTVETVRQAAFRLFKQGNQVTIVQLPSVAPATPTL